MHGENLKLIRKYFKLLRRSQLYI